MYIASDLTGSSYKKKKNCNDLTPSLSNANSISDFFSFLQPLFAMICMAT